MAPPQQNTNPKDLLKIFIFNNMLVMLKNTIQLVKEMEIQKNKFNIAICYSVNEQIPAIINTYYHQYFQKSSEIISKFFDTLKNDTNKDPICVLHFMATNLIKWNFKLTEIYNDLYDNYSEENINTFLEHHFIPEESFNFVDVGCNNCTHIPYDPDKNLMSLVMQEIVSE